MKQKKHILSVLMLALSLLVLILDAKTSLKGAAKGVSLCLEVVIPSLFPFLFLSAMLPSRLLGRKIKGTKWLCNLCGIPEGAESLLFLGFIGGYPVGAGLVTEAYKQGSISREVASRMLGFCNNAGPGFIFGMVGGLFPNKKVVWLLWLIHIISAIFVSVVLPNKSTDHCVIIQKSPESTTGALESSMRTMLRICGWVIIFRVILAILDRWLLWLFPQEVSVIVSGILELTNGISGLYSLPNAGTRFVLSSIMLSFGGVCIYMQTTSVSKGLDCGTYFPGKVLQCLISTLLSAHLQNFLFTRNDQIHIPTVFLIILFAGTCSAILLLQKKKVVAYLG